MKTIVVFLVTTNKLYSNTRGKRIFFWVSVHKEKTRSRRRQRVIIILVERQVDYFTVIAMDY